MQTHPWVRKNISTSWHTNRLVKTCTDDCKHSTLNYWDSTTTNTPHNGCPWHVSPLTNCQVNGTLSYFSLPTINSCWLNFPFWCTISHNSAQARSLLCTDVLNVRYWLRNGRKIDSAMNQFTKSFSLFLAGLPAG